MLGLYHGHPRARLWRRMLSNPTMRDKDDANLLLGRSVARQREIAIRVSLGATRGRLVRQLLTETSVLALTGGAAGLLLAYWGVAALLALAPADLPRLAEVQPDATTIAFAFAVALATPFVFGLVPALQASRVEAGSAMKDEGTRTAGSRSQRRLHQALVVSELATNAVRHARSPFRVSIGRAPAGVVLTVENTGAAFGILQGSGTFLIVTSLIAIGAILRFAVEVTVQGIDLQVVGLILMIAGGGRHSPRRHLSSSGTASEAHSV